MKTGNLRLAESPSPLSPERQKLAEKIAECHEAQAALAGMHEGLKLAQRRLYDELYPAVTKAEADVQALKASAMDTVITGQLPSVATRAARSRLEDAEYDVKATRDAIEKLTESSAKAGQSLSWRQRALEDLAHDVIKASPEFAAMKLEYKKAKRRFIDLQNLFGWASVGGQTNRVVEDWEANPSPGDLPTKSVWQAAHTALTVDPNAKLPGV